MEFCPNCGYRDNLCHCFSNYGQYHKHSPTTCNHVSRFNDKNLCCSKNPNPHWKKCKPSHHYPSKKTCKESLSELISSAANIENALANAINAEISILKNGNFTPEQIIVLTNKLENLLKLAIKKEIILEFLIEDATKACKMPRKCKGHNHHYDC